MVPILPFFFFFQAEDGIRDWSVTGVQTCALPISHLGREACPLNTFLDPIRERRARFAAKMGLVRDALADGTDRARKAARATMALVHGALDLGYLEKFRGQ